jgi:hypothetical protein
MSNHLFTLPDGPAGDTALAAAWQCSGEVSDVCTDTGRRRVLVTEASRHFVAHLSQPGPATLARLDAWLAESPCHHCALRLVRTTWDALGGAAN